MQVSSYFTSVGFTISAIIFMSLTIMVYIKKKNSTNLSGKIFLGLLILTSIILAFEMVVPYTMSRMNDLITLNNVLCRIYVLLMYLWE